MSMRQLCIIHRFRLPALRSFRQVKYAAVFSKQFSHSDGNLKGITDFKKLSNEEWSRRLTPLEYEVCRMGGTETPFSGEYNAMYASGIYTCVCCGAELFSSESKYNSGSGWPSFYDSLPHAVQERSDSSHGMNRVELQCSKCGSHLGHVFDDGPHPTGRRFCINSVCLDFMPETH